MAEYAMQLVAAESISDVVAATRRVVTEVVGADGGTFAVAVGRQVRLIELTDIETDVASSIQHLTIGDDNPISECVRTGQPSAFAGATDLVEAYPHLRSTIDAGGHQSYAVAPLLSHGGTGSSNDVQGSDIQGNVIQGNDTKGRVIGAVGAVWRRPATLDEALISSLRHLALMAGTALDRVRRLEDERTLALLATDLSRATDLDEVRRVIATSAAKLLDATSVEIGVASGDVLIHPNSVAPDSPELQRWHRVPLSESVPATDALRTNKTIVISDEVAWNRYPNIASTRHSLGVEAFVATPLRTNRTRGILALSFRDPGAHDDRCRGLIDRIVDAASQAIDRADLLKTEREAQRRSRLVRELTESLPNTFRLTDAAALAIARIRALERATSVAIAWGLPDDTDRVETLAIEESDEARQRTIPDRVEELRVASAPLTGAGTTDRSPLPWFESRDEPDGSVFRWGFDLNEFVVMLEIEWQDPAFELTAEHRASMIADLRTVSRALHRIALQAGTDRQRDRMGKLMAGTATGWWTWEIDTDTVRWSPGVAAMLGSDRDAPSLDAAIRTLDSSSRRRLQAAISRAIEHGDEYELELRTVTGRWVWTKSLLVDGPGDQRILMGLIRDVTDRKEVALALEASHQRQRNIIDALFSLVIIIAPNGSVIDVNRSVIRAVTGDADTMVERPFWELTLWNQQPDNTNTLRSELHRATHSGSPQRFDVEATVADEPCILDVQIVPVLDRSRAIDYLVVSAIDITRRVEYEDRLADLLDRQRTIARRLQDALLPRSLPDLPGYELAARYEAAEGDLDVGGDWYDVFRLSNGRVAFAIGDIVGRGLDAAGATGHLRSVTRAVAETAGGPAGVVAAVDRFAMSTPGTLGASFLYLELDPSTGMIEACRAGHMPPALLDPSGAVQLIEENGSALLGVGRTDERPTVTFSLTPGSTLLLYTDGLVERPRRTLDVGLDQLATLLGYEPVHTRLTTFLAVVAESMSTEEPTRDDVCLLAIRRAAQPSTTG